MPPGADCPAVRLVRLGSWPTSSSKDVFSEVKGLFSWPGRRWGSGNGRRERTPALSTVRCVAARAHCRAGPAVPVSSGDFLLQLTRGVEEERDVPPSSRKDRGRTKTSDPKGRVRRGRPKVCIFCTEHIPYVDYKDMNLLRRFMSDRGKIKSRANTGTCSQHQSDVALAIKNARELALLPYAVRTLAGDKSAGRRGRGAGRPGDRPTGDRPTGDRPTGDRPTGPPTTPPPTGSVDAAANGGAGDLTTEAAPVAASVGAGTAPGDAAGGGPDTASNEEVQG
jgi:small subunit ribosomal protein S18